jgi:hypothetical protein
MTLILSCRSSLNPWRDRKIFRNCCEVNFRNVATASVCGDLQNNPMTAEPYRFLSRECAVSLPQQVPHYNPDHPLGWRFQPCPLSCFSTEALPRMAIHCEAEPFHQVTCLRSHFCPERERIFRCKAGVPVVKKI